MKITVIGAAGRMGSMHARHLIEMGHEVTCVDPVDLPDDLATRRNDGNGAMGWWTHDIDGVVVATPAAHHLADLGAAVRAGCHVFIEKPLCLIGQSAKAREILERATEKGLIVATGYNLRFHPLVMQARDAIATGQLSPLWGSFLLRQKPARPIAHFLEEWASHEVDLAMHLLGCNDIHFGNVLNEIDDFSFMGGPNDINGHYLRLFMTHGNGHSFVLADDAGVPPRRSFTLVDQDGRSLTSDIETDHVQPAHYRAELQAWLDLIQVHGEDLKRSHAWRVATGWDGLAAIELLERLVK